MCSSDLSTATVGLLVAAFSAARLLVNVPAGQLSTKFGYARVMSVGLAVLAAGSVLPYATADIAVLALGVVVQGLGSSLFSTSVLVAIAALSTPESRVRDMSTYQGAQVVGVALGPALGGMVASLWGYPATFLWQAGLALAALAAVVAVRRRIPSAPQTAPGAAAVPGAAIPMGPFAAVGLMTFALLATRVATAWLIMPL